jgi:Mrp family chromosome partitioning ATPase
VGTILFSKLDPDADSCLACIRAGQMLAVGSTGRTCIVDADFSHPSLHERFSLASQAGMLDLFRASSPANNYLRPSGPQNLWFLSAGMVSREGPATLEWDRVNVLLADLGARFDHVVIRGPALESGTESVVLGGLTDGLVLIVEQSQTRRRSTEEIVRQIRQSQIGVRAAILIKTGSRVSQFQIAPRFPHDRFSRTHASDDSYGPPARSHWP